MTAIERWENPVPMRCSHESREPVHAGEEVYPGGVATFGCREDAYFIEVEGEDVLAFFCYQHGRERAARLEAPTTTREETP